MKILYRLFFCYWSGHNWFMGKCILCGKKLNLQGLDGRDAMKAERLGRTDKQLNEHQLAILAENAEEERWLAEIVSRYMVGKSIYPVGYSEGENGKRALSLSVGE